MHKGWFLHPTLEVGTVLVGPLGEWGERFFAPTCSGPSGAMDGGRRAPRDGSGVSRTSLPYAGLSTSMGGEWIKAEKTSEKASEKTSGKIIALIKDDAAITIERLAEYCGVTTRSIERNLKKLQQRHIIKRVGPDKGGHWEVIE